MIYFLDKVVQRSSLCEICKFSLCLHRFSTGSPVADHIPSVQTCCHSKLLVHVVCASVGDTKIERVRVKERERDKEMK